MNIYLMFKDGDNCHITTLEVVYLNKRFLCCVIANVIAFSLMGCSAFRPEESSTESAGDSVTVTSSQLNDDVGEIKFTPTEQEHITKTDDAIMYADNEVLIVVKDGTNYDAVQELAARYNAEIVGMIELTGDYQLRFSTTYSESEFAELTSQFIQEEVIERADLNYFYPIRNDSVDYGDEWRKDLKDYEDLKGKSWGVEAILAPDAWEELNKHSAQVNPVRVGLIDSGFDTTHEDLKDCFVSVFYNDSPNPHGTHVAGTMAANADNSEGICGVYPYGKNHLYGASWSQSRYSENNISYIQAKCCLAELILRNVKVINCSYGYGDINLIMKYNNLGTNPNYGVDVTEDYRKFIDMQADGIGEYLQRFYNKGYDFIIVASAGNQSNKEFDLKYDTVLADGSETHIEQHIQTGVVEADDSSVYNAISEDKYPDIYNRIIVVGSVDDKLHMSSFSNGGQRVDVFAPGEKIFSTANGTYQHTYQEDGKTKLWSGTSMAAPHVSGVAAMVWSANNHLTGAEVKRIVCDSGKLDQSDPFDSMLGEVATSLHYIEGNDASLVNAQKAVRKALGIESESNITNQNNGSVLCWVVEKGTDDKISNAAVIARSADTRAC